MRPIRVVITPITALTTAFATGVTSTGAALTLAATAATDTLAHLVTLTSSGGVDLSSLSFTVVGKDSNANVITDTIATGPNGSTVTTTKHFATLTSVTPSATMAGKVMSIGIGAESVSPVFPCDGRSGYPSGIHAVVTGTVNYTVQETFGNPFIYDTETLPWNNITALTSKATTLSSLDDGATTALRVMINSVTNGATVTLWYNTPAQITG